MGLRMMLFSEYVFLQHSLSDSCLFCFLHANAKNIKCVLGCRFLVKA